MTISEEAVMNLTSKRGLRLNLNFFKVHQLRVLVLRQQMNFDFVFTLPRYLMEATTNRWVSGEKERQGQGSR